MTTNFSRGRMAADTSDTSAGVVTKLTTSEFCLIDVLHEGLRHRPSKSEPLAVCWCKSCRSIIISASCRFNWQEINFHLLLIVVDGEHSSQGIMCGGLLYFACSCKRLWFAAEFDWHIWTRAVLCSFCVGWRDLHWFSRRIWWRRRLWRRVWQLWLFWWSVMQ